VTWRGRDTTTNTQSARRSGCRCFDELSDPLTVAPLAAEAEEAGCANRNG
jgi:hypothetical protein